MELDTGSDETLISEQVCRDLSNLVPFSFMPLMHNLRTYTEEPALKLKGQVTVMHNDQVAQRTRLRLIVAGGGEPSLNLSNSIQWSWKVYSQSKGVVSRLSW